MDGKGGWRSCVEKMLPLVCTKLMDMAVHSGETHTNREHTADRADPIENTRTDAHTRGTPSQRKKG